MWSCGLWSVEVGGPVMTRSSFVAIEVESALSNLIRMSLLSSSAVVWIKNVAKFFGVPVGSLTDDRPTTNGASTDAKKIPTPRGVTAPPDIATPTSVTSIASAALSATSSGTSGGTSSGDGPGTAARQKVVQYYNIYRLIRENNSIFGNLRITRVLCVLVIISSLCYENDISILFILETLVVTLPSAIANNGLEMWRADYQGGVHGIGFSGSLSSLYSTISGLETGHAGTVVGKTVGHAGEVVGGTVGAATSTVSAAAVSGVAVASSIATATATALQRVTVKDIVVDIILTLYEVIMRAWHMFPGLLKFLADWNSWTRIMRKNIVDFYLKDLCFGISKGIAGWYNSHVFWVEHIPDFKHSHFNSLRDITKATDLPSFRAFALELVIPAFLQRWTHNVWTTLEWFYKHAKTLIIYVERKILGGTALENVIIYLYDAVHSYTSAIISDIKTTTKDLYVVHINHHVRDFRPIFDEGHKIMRMVRTGCKRILFSIEYCVFLLLHYKFYYVVRMVLSIVTMISGFAVRYSLFFLDFNHMLGTEMTEQQWDFFADVIAYCLALVFGIKLVTIIICHIAVMLHIANKALIHLEIKYGIRYEPGERIRGVFTEYYHPHSLERESGVKSGVMAGQGGLDADGPGGSDNPGRLDMLGSMKEFMSPLTDSWKLPPRPTFGRTIADRTHPSKFWHNAEGTGLNENYFKALHGKGGAEEEEENNDSAHENVAGGDKGGGGDDEDHTMGGTNLCPSIPKITIHPPSSIEAASPVSSVGKLKSIAQSGLTKIKNAPSALKNTLKRNSTAMKNGDKSGSQQTAHFDDSKHEEEPTVGGAFGALAGGGVFGNSVNPSGSGRRGSLFQSARVNSMRRSVVTTPLDVHANIGAAAGASNAALRLLQRREKQGRLLRPSFLGGNEFGSASGNLNRMVGSSRSFASGDFGVTRRGMGFISEGSDENSEESDANHSRKSRSTGTGRDTGSSSSGSDPDRKTAVPNAKFPSRPSTLQRAGRITPFPNISTKNTGESYTPHGALTASRSGSSPRNRGDSSSDGDREFQSAVQIFEKPQRRQGILSRLWFCLCHDIDVCADPDYEALHYALHNLEHVGGQNNSMQNDNMGMDTKDRRTDSKDRWRAGSKDRRTDSKDRHPSKKHRRNPGFSAIPQDSDPQEPIEIRRASSRLGELPKFGVPNDGRSNSRSTKTNDMNVNVMNVYGTSRNMSGIGRALGSVRMTSMGGRGRNSVRQSQRFGGANSRMTHTKMTQPFWSEQKNLMPGAGSGGNLMPG